MESAMMRLIGVSVLACVLGLACGVAPSLIAQEAGKEAAKSEKGEKKGAKKEAKSDDRLPPNFGKVGLSDEQRKKIYAIQDQHEKEIKDLQKKLADLKAKQQDEFEAVLTSNQKQLLQEHVENSKKKSSEKNEKKKEAKPDGEKKTEKSS